VEAVLLVSIHLAIAASHQATLHVMLFIIAGAVAQAVTTVLEIAACQINSSLVTRVIGRTILSRSTAYARFLNALAVKRKAAPDLEFEGCEEILAHLSIKEESNQPVKVTDLVRSLQFGTGPTVQRKVSTLSERGFIKVSASKTDGRAKNIMLTKAGKDLLKERTKLMASMLKA